jgi:uncharacterized protein YidB (DUF937 family)
MGLMDMVQSFAGGSGNADHAKVAGGLMEELQSHPGGISGVLQAFQQNGMGGTAQQWANGQTQPANPNDIEAGLGGTGIIDSIAQRTGLSPTIVKAGLAAAVPLLVHHMVSGGHVTADGQQTGSPPEAGGLLQSLLQRMG